MSKSTDGIRTKGKMQKASCFLFFTFYFLLFALLFSAGCSNEQRAVELYVDAVMLKELNENEKAVEKLNSAVRLSKGFSLAYSLLGEIYQQINDYEKSTASYEKATELNPWSFTDYFNLGRVYQLMEKFALAVKAYSRACELEPDHLEAHINNAKCYYELKDYKNALMVAARAEQIDPNVSEVQKILGDIYESQEDYSQAIRSYKRALEIDSNNPDIMTSLAVAYLRTNSIEPAKELLTSAIQIQPDKTAAYQYLGYCYLQFYYEAITSYKRELETDSANTTLISSLKKDAEEAVDKAMQSYSKAIELNDDDWEAHRGLGVAYMIRATDKDNKDETLKAQLRAKAIQQWRLSLDIKPDQPHRERLVELIRKYSK